MSELAAAEAYAVSPADLSVEVRDDLYVLFERYYAQTTRQSFEHDLNEKDLVVLVRAVEDRTVRGFTTLRHLRAIVGGDSIAAFYLW